MIAWLTASPAAAADASSPDPQAAPNAEALNAYAVTGNKAYAAADYETALKTFGAGLAAGPALAALLVGSSGHYSGVVALAGVDGGEAFHVYVQAVAAHRQIGETKRAGCGRLLTGSESGS